MSATINYNTQGVHQGTYAPQVVSYNNPIYSDAGVIWTPNPTVVVIRTVADLEDAPRYSDGTYNLVKARLNNADLRGADLRGANLCGAYLEYADLRGADLTDANLTGADLAETKFAGAVLIRTDISSAFIGGAHFEGSNASDTIGVPLSTDIAETEFDDKDLPDMANRMGLRIMCHTWGGYSLARI